MTLGSFSTYSPGFTVNARDYGLIDKCPYCVRVQVKRLSKNQITCGHDQCKAKHQQRKKGGKTA